MVLRTMAALGAEDEAALGAEWFGESLDTPKIYFGMFFETAFGLADGFWCARAQRTQCAPARLCTRARRTQARPRARMRTQEHTRTRMHAHARTRACAAMRAPRSESVRTSGASVRPTLAQPSAARLCRGGYARAARLQHRDRSGGVRQLLEHARARGTVQRLQLWAPPATERVCLLCAGEPERINRRSGRPRNDRTAQQCEQPGGRVQHG